MKSSIKIAIGEIRFYDGSVSHFSSMEQLLRIVAREYEKKGMAEIVKIEGVDDEGSTYKLGFDFNIFQIQENNVDSVLLKRVKKQKFLGELLVETGIITPKQLETAMLEQDKSGHNEKIGEVLIRLGYCNAEQILYALAKQIGNYLKSGGKDEK